MEQDEEWGPSSVLDHSRVLQVDRRGLCVVLIGCRGSGRASSMRTRILGWGLGGADLEMGP